MRAANDSPPKTLAELATRTGATDNKAPGWIKHGALVYRVCTPEDPDFLASTEAGLGITYHLLDGSIEQIPLMTGVIGDDHTGICNWDGIWPYWSHVSYRAKNWDYLRGFMQRVSDKCNTKVSFHVNLTDVNVGLRAYPETRDFFKKLVETKSIYRRDRNPASRRDYLEPPYVPQEIPANEPNPISIFALVHYQNFWDSGLAKQMIDDLYSHLPYAPPVLYLDVLTLEGGNFNTGFPHVSALKRKQRDAQEEGALAIANAALRSKGTEIGTEGDRAAPRRPRHLVGGSTASPVIPPTITARSRAQPRAAPPCSSMSWEIPDASSSLPWPPLRTRSAKFANTTLHSWPALPWRCKMPGLGNLVHFRPNSRQRGCIQYVPQGRWRPIHDAIGLTWSMTFTSPASRNFSTSAMAACAPPFSKKSATCISANSCSRT